MMKFATYLKLGRVSNLPTVWSNIFTGIVLAMPVEFHSPEGLLLNGAGLVIFLVIMKLAFSMQYVAGMFLNDAYDANYDLRFRPDRPIPAGKAGKSEVFFWGFGLLFSGLALYAGAVFFFHHFLQSIDWKTALLSAPTIAIIILIYDLKHKNFFPAALSMGLIRSLLYFQSAFAVGSWPDRILIPAILLFVYTTFVTLLSWRENDSVKITPRLIMQLIAGMTLLDAVVLFFYGFYFSALLPVLYFVMTLAWQRRIAGS